MLCPSAFEGSVRRRYEGRLYFALQLDPPIPPKYKVNSLHFPCIWFGLAWIQLGLAWFSLAAAPGLKFSKSAMYKIHAPGATPPRIVSITWRLASSKAASSSGRPSFKDAISCDALAYCWVVAQIM